MPRKAWIGFAAVLGVILIVTLRLANGLTGLTQGGASVRIGAIDPLTGPFAAYGEPVRDGMLPAADESNAKRGIEGGKIETAIPNRPPSSSTTTTTTTELSSSQLSSEHSSSPRQATMGESLCSFMNAMSPVLNLSSLLISIMSLWIAWYAMRDGKQLAKQIPRDLRILVPVDQESPETGAWGKSLLYGIREYFRQRGATFYIQDQAYRFIVDDPSDAGKPLYAKKIAYSLLHSDTAKPFPLAVIGPISTSCAEASIRFYRDAYDAKKAIHLLPVPTGTALLSESLNDGEPSLSPCIFRLPPSNRRQAETIVRTIEVLDAKDCWEMFCLTYPESNYYIPDLQEMVEKEVHHRWGYSKDSLTISMKEVLNGSWFDLHVRKQYKLVLVIGAWHARGEFPCVGDFIRNWRMEEQRLGINRTKILLSDFPVPGAVQECIEGSIQLDQVYATFQMGPDTLKKTVQHVPTCDTIDLSLIAYGYDSARLIDYLIQKNATVDPDHLVEALRKIPQFDGFAQTYQFSEITNENMVGKFHVYRFARNRNDAMPHYDEGCPCITR